VLLLGFCIFGGSSTRIMKCGYGLGSGIELEVVLTLNLKLWLYSGGNLV